MKKLLLILLVAISSLPTFARYFYYNYEGHTLTYFVLDEDAKTCKVAKILDSGDIIIPAVAEEYRGDIKYTVTEIDDFAAVDCTRLTSVTIPESVTKIGAAAFWGCIGLTSMIIPASVTTIGAWAFKGCDGLTELVFNAENCNYCGTINCFAFPSSLQKVTIGDNVKKIPDYAFSGCNQLTEVNISSIENWLNIEFESYVSNPTYYAKKLFVKGDLIRDLIIPEGTKRINPYCFLNCEQFITVTLPDSLESIGGAAFDGCSGLENVYFQSTKIWNRIIFHGESANPISQAHKFTVNGSEVEHLDMDIDNSNVSDYAFCNARNLKTIRVKGTGTGHYSFSDCKNVTDICLDVQSLGKASFMGCNSVRAIYCLTTQPPGANIESFSKYEGVTLYVPVGSLSKYENANCWSRFLDIVETDFSGIDAIFKADYTDDDTPGSVEKVWQDRDNSDVDFSAPYDVYTLNGTKLGDSTESLAPGIYIVRQGIAAKRIIIE